MLLYFTVNNFRSFRDAQSLIMTPQKALKEHKQTNIATSGEYEALKSIAILGHNANGKSNLIDALFRMRYFILSSFNDLGANSNLEYTPFRYTNDSSSNPTEFEIEFLFKNKKYRYGYSYNKERIVSEWLFIRNNKSRAKETFLFIREGDTFNINSSLLQGAISLKDRTKKNMLFLSVAALFNIQEAENVQEWFRDYLAVYPIIFGSVADYRTYEELCNESSNFKKRLMDIVKQADLSITNLFAEKRKIYTDEQVTRLKTDVPTFKPEQQFSYNLFSEHNVYNKEGEIIDSIPMKFDSTESKGTQKYVSIAAPIIDSLDNGVTLVFDELGSDLHPLLFLYIVSLFNSDKSNCSNAQIIFTTHNTDILDIGNMRRDQILFVEKDRTEASRIYPLSQFKVRNHKSFSKSYLLGRYGAIPMLQNLTIKND